MLKNINSFSTVVLVGGSSDIGQAIINNLKLAKNAKIYFVGRSLPEKLEKSKEFNFVYCDLVDRSNLLNTFEELQKIEKIDLFIFAAGCLPPENKELDHRIVEETISVNTYSAVFFLSVISNKMINSGGGQILLISSVATLRPRIRNFTYGASKGAADFFARGLAFKMREHGVHVSILRPGFVFTKLTRDFKKAPFAAHPDLVGKIAAKGIKNKQMIIYAPKKLKLVMALTYLLPRAIFDKF
jgi:decaprenylphospho-beta-D-erythro-pentofuranosid-2-ulose 2-reductase